VSNDYESLTSSAFGAIYGKIHRTDHLEAWILNKPSVYGSTTFIV
jgi:hypothetical protein